MNHTYKYKNYKEMLLGILGQYKFRMIFSMLIVVVRGVILLLPSVVTQRIIDVILPQEIGRAHV